MKVTMQAPCRLCEQLVPITGDAELVDGVLMFTSDDAGTAAGWEHQRAHDDGELDVAGGGS